MNRLVRFVRSRFAWYLGASAIVIAAVVVASGQLVGRFFERETLAHEQDHTVQMVRAHAREHLTPADFAVPNTAVRPRHLSTFFDDLHDVFRVKLFDLEGRVVWSNEPRLIGLTFPENPNLARARAGHVVTVLGTPHGAEHVFERERGVMAETYVPITAPGRGLVGVVETYRDLTAHVAGIRRTQWFVWWAAAALGALLWSVLAAVVWNAWQGERNAIERLEARNDELTVLQDFSDAMLKPLTLAQLPRSVVESAGRGLRLTRATLYRVRPDGDVVERACWPDQDPGGEPVGDDSALVREALITNGEAVSGATVALPMPTHRGVEHVLIVGLREPVAAGGAAKLGALRIMLHEATIALSNADLFSEVREAHERLAAILAGVVDRMLIVDRDMRVVWMNEAVAEMHPGDTHRAGTHPGESCFTLLGADDEACQGCPAVRTFTSGRVERGVRAQRVPGGRVRFLDLVAAPLRDTGGEVYQVLEVSRDITELVEMEERLKQSAARLEDSHTALSAKAAELERANQALKEAQAKLVEQERLAAVGQVVVGLHHAILNPLTGILGALHVLKQDTSLASSTLQAIAAAETEIERAAHLVRRLPQITGTPDTRYVGTMTMLDLERAWDEDARQ